MSAARSVIYWDYDESAETLHYTDIDDAITCLLEDLDPTDWPETLVVFGYARELVEETPSAVGLVENILEELDERYGSPDDATGGTPNMLAAANKFIAEIVGEYESCSCEVVETRDVDLRRWVREVRPEWIDAHRPDWRGQ